MPGKIIPGFFLFYAKFIAVIYVFILFCDIIFSVCFLGGIFMDKNLNNEKSTSLKELSLISLGILMVATAVHFFLVPSNLTTGGAGGLLSLIHI